MKRNLVLLLIGAVVIGVGIIYYATQTDPQTYQVTVVAATLDISPGMVITVDMLGAVQVKKPEAGEISYYIYNPNAILPPTKEVVATQGFLTGQPLDSRGLSEEEVPPGWTMASGEVIAPGMRGLALEVDQFLSVGGTVKAGAQVTLYCAEDDFEAVQKFLRDVASLDPLGGQSPAEEPGEERLIGQVSLTMEKLPVVYKILYQHVRVLDIRQGPTAGGNSLVRGEALAGEAGALYILLDLTDEQAQNVLECLWRERLAIALEGEGGVEE